MAATRKSYALIGNDRSEEDNNNHGGLTLHPPKIYGARPILPGEVADKYVPKMPSSLFSFLFIWSINLFYHLGAGAPAKNPQPPGNNPPYRYAFAPSSPVLMTDDSAFALYPPQKFRIYKREVEMPIGPP